LFRLTSFRLNPFRLNPFRLNPFPPHPLEEPSKCSASKKTKLSRTSDPAR